MCAICAYLCLFVLICAICAYIKLIKAALAHQDLQLDAMEKCTGADSFSFSLIFQAQIVLIEMCYIYNVLLIVMCIINIVYVIISYAVYINFKTPNCQTNSSEACKKVCTFTDRKC